MSEEAHGRAYRNFFPTGLAFALGGTALWLAFDAGVIAYPGAVHADVMVGGFLFAFASGFLMTALPRFSGSPAASGLEQTSIGVVLAVEAVAAILGGSHRSFVMHLALALGMGLLIAFAVARFRLRASALPPSFGFVGLGLACGLAGAILMAIADIRPERSVLAVPGRLLLIQGFMPALVIGVGGKLFPGLLGLAPITPRAVGPTRIPPTMIAAALLFAASFPVELLASPTVGRAMRAFVATFAAWAWWRVVRPSPRKGQLPFWLRAGALFFVLGLWGMVAFPKHLLEAEHVLFIGGFGLVILAVATRVVVSHEGLAPTLELTSRALAVAGILVVMALVTRVGAFATGSAYTTHLAIAAGLWMLGLVSWSAPFVPKLFGRR